MSNSKECKFKSSTFQVGDVVKLVDINGLYSSKNVYGLERLELNKDYTVCSVKDNGEFISLIKDNGVPEGVFSYRLIRAEPATTAESLRNSILSLQQERVSLQEKIEQNIAQEKSLTEQLKELGFLLVENKEQPTNVVDEKHTLDTVKVGDMVECISTDDPGYRVGKLYTEEGEVYTVSDVEHLKGVDKIKVDVKEVDGGIGIMGVNYKFHSRPVVK